MFDSAAFEKKSSLAKLGRKRRTVLAAKRRILGDVHEGRLVPRSKSMRMAANLLNSMIDQAKESQDLFSAPHDEMY